jgi:hypothetical protein
VYSEREMEEQVGSIWEWVVYEKPLPNKGLVVLYRDGSAFGRYEFRTLEFARGWLENGGLVKLDYREHGGLEVWGRKEVERTPFIEEKRTTI